MLTKTSRLLVAALLVAAGAVVMQAPPAAADAVITGEITAGDPLQQGRVVRDGFGATCAAPKGNPGMFDSSPYHYDQHEIVGTPGACVTVTFNATNDRNVYVGAFASPYNPAAPSSTFLADGGLSTGFPPSPVSFEVVVPASGTFVLVALDTNGGVGAQYIIEVSGAVASCSATPTITATPGTPTVGTPGDDIILGTDGPDAIDGRGGNDTIIALGGDDRIASGDGNDTVCAGDGNDSVAGNGGADRLFGGAGNDRLDGGAGDDHLVGGGGSDQLLGGSGTDTCQAGGDPGDATAGCEAA